ncbi:MAG: Xaa-Pro aminopeptidase, partial [Bacteroidetes bacterium]|nr:Xaa-Pro aminopeptidase [Bacteroidota bacterium]
MRYSQIDSKLFIENRERFKKMMKPNSVAVFISNDIVPKTADQFHNFRQNGDLFYLTGIEQEETMLILAPDCPNPDFREILFLRETNETLAIWEGAKHSKTEGTSISGIKAVQWNSSFENQLAVIINLSENIYLNLNEHDRYVSSVPYADLRFANEIKNRFPAHNIERAAPIMHRLRSVKSPIEVELIKHAGSITKKAFDRVLDFIKPGVMEFEIEAEITHEFLMNGSMGHAYTPIIASGANACVLHYISNNMQVKDGDLLLLDFGADYANYASDLTRCVPANGKFSPRQKEVYNSVLRVFYAAQDMLKPGTFLKDYNEAVGKLMEKELVDLKLLTLEEIKNQKPEWPAYKKYFMHGTSHYMGIDVHDLGGRYWAMQAGNVFTCEPGIYIPAE